MSGAFVVDGDWPNNVGETRDAHLPDRAAVGLVGLFGFFGPATLRPACPIGRRVITRCTTRPTVVTGLASAACSR